MNNNDDGDLSHGWITLPAEKAKGGALGCPSVRYLPSDGYYYTVSGGNIIPLMRSKDLLSWETANGAIDLSAAYPPAPLTHSHTTSYRARPDLSR